MKPPPISKNSKPQPRVVIVGAGFGGLTAAQRIARLPVQVTVVDRRNHHIFQPLLYQVATAGLSPGEIAAPIRSILRNRGNIEVLLEEIVDFKLLEKKIIAKEQTLDYDFLVIASGATHAYFGHDEWQPLAPGLKTIEDAIEIRRRVLLAFELAERQAANGQGSSPLQFVVIGGGPTGVELAGTLAEIARHAMNHEFRNIDPRQSRILLIEGSHFPYGHSRRTRLGLGRRRKDFLPSHLVGGRRCCFSAGPQTGCSRRSRRSRARPTRSQHSRT
jgi:NADH dehydrogenase